MNPKTKQRIVEGLIIALGLTATGLLGFSQFNPRRGGPDVSLENIQRYGERQQVVAETDVYTTFHSWLSVYAANANTNDPSQRSRVRPTYVGREMRSAAGVPEFRIHEGTQRLSVIVETGSLQRVQIDTARTATEVTASYRGRTFPIKWQEASGMYVHVAEFPAEEGEQKLTVRVGYGSGEFDEFEAVVTGQ